MRSRLLKSAPAVVLTALCLGCGEEPARVLKICADPNNLPFSNERRVSFRDETSDPPSRDKKAARSEHTCDEVMGGPADPDMVAGARPSANAPPLYAWDRASGGAATGGILNK